LFANIIEFYSGHLLTYKVVGKLPTSPKLVPTSLAVCAHHFFKFLGQPLCPQKMHLFGAAFLGTPFLGQPFQPFWGHLFGRGLFWGRLFEAAFFSLFWGSLFWGSLFASKKSPKNVPFKFCPPVKIH